jgi:hypothetical protein
LLGSFSLSAQDKKELEVSTSQDAKDEMETEEVDGVFELAGYLGKKLVEEVGNRIESGESKEEKNQKAKRVSIKIGPIKIERIEGR